MITLTGYIAITVMGVTAIAGTLLIVRDYCGLRASERELERLQYNKFQLDNHMAFGEHFTKESVKRDPRIHKVRD